MKDRETYNIGPDIPKADPAEKRLLRSWTIGGPVIGTILLAAASCGGQGASSTPTATEAVTPSPTPYVVMCSLEEEDTNGDDIGKTVPTGGETRTALENCYIANQVIVRFEPGTEADGALSEVIKEFIKENGSVSSKEEFEELKAEIRKGSLELLGLNEEWGMERFIDSENGFTVLLVVPEEVLQNMPLGEVVGILEQKDDVANATENNLLSLQ